MPIMVTVKDWGLGAKPKPKAQQVTTPAPKRPGKDDPKTVDEVVRRLRRLGSYPMATGPYDAEDYDALTRRRLDWMAQRSRLLTFKNELGKRTDNDAIQAKTTEVLSVDDVRKNASRVKKSEAWRHKQLDSMQQQAEVELEQVIRSELGGPAVTARYGRIGGGHDPFMVSAAMQRDWVEWRAKAARHGVLIEAVVDCIREPWTMAEVERRHGIKGGDGIANHRLGLDVWAEQRQWVRAGYATTRLTNEGR